MAVTVTLSATPAPAARLGPAYGAKLGLKDASGNPRNATISEVEAYLLTVMQSDVLGYEYEQAKAAIVSTPL
jgi:hypothetical protein